MKCPFCKMDMKPWDIKKTHHLIVTKDIKKHIHVHGPINDKGIIREFIATIKKEANIE